MRERALGTANKAIGFGRIAARLGAEPAGEQARPHRAGSLYTQALPGQSTDGRCTRGRGRSSASRQDARYGLVNGGTDDGRRGRAHRQARYPAPSAGATLLNTSR
jgi:hypothetical protein